MRYHVWYDPGFNEGWEFETFVDFSEALNFSKKQSQSEIYIVDACSISLADNINLNIC